MPTDAPDIAVPEPTSSDLDLVVRDLERGLTATLTVRRQSPDDIGYREIYLSLDGADLGVLHSGKSITCEIEPGRHELRAHNTLFRKALSFDATVGDHVRFQAVNRSGWATYSTLAVFIGFLGAGPIHLTLTRETDDAPVAPDPGPGGTAR